MKPVWRGAPRIYAVLFSAASTAVYEDYVTPQRFDWAVDAGTHGQSVRNAQGLEFEVMRLVEGRWMSCRGESPVQVIARRWAA